MATLEQYLVEDFLLDKQEITTLDQMIAKAARTFDVTFKSGWWPYSLEATNQSNPIVTSNSQGTSAMVLTAVGRVLGRCASKLPAPLDDAEFGEKWKMAFKALAANVEAVDQGAHVRSKTFGDNNPLTLSHLADLHLCLLPGNGVDKSAIGRHLGRARAAVKKIIKDPLSISTNLLSPPADPTSYQPNAFVPVRAMLACKALNPAAEFLLHRPFFESALHDQLSFSAIPDSRFDPAELLFCLEGLIISAPAAVEEALFDRVLHVLEVSQSTSAHWRPNKPFIATSTGSIMLPLSVEGANSLMRSAKEMDRGRRQDLFASKALPLLGRFWDWIMARAVRFERDGKSCVGWHSEHVNEPGLIHIWDTSQILEFMITFREVLSAHIARKALQLSAVKVRQHEPLTKTLGEKYGTKPGWGDIVEDREPTEKLGPRYQVYRRVGEHFVTPRISGGDEAYSMMLYGPPGTGKSTLAELVADALEWPLITITVSDFLGSGGAMVEARAKAIFQMLEAQNDCVILFDEIDAFLLDRDSKFYRDQDTVFQFLTPGMLTKINDLRHASRSIFIIATNYENRIDPAIKRVGRIDKRLLLLPPDLTRRTAMIEAAINLHSWPVKGENQRPSQVEIDAAAKASLYLGWSDIKRATKARFKKVEDMAATLSTADKSTGPEHYGRRVPTEKSGLQEEVRCLYELGKEVDSADFERDFVKAAREAAEEGNKVNAEQMARSLLADTPVQNEADA